MTNYPNFWDAYSELYMFLSKSSNQGETGALQCLMEMKHAYSLVVDKQQELEKLIKEMNHDRRKQHS